MNHANKSVFWVCVLLVQSIFHLVQLEHHNKNLIFISSIFTMKIRLALFFKFFDHKRCWYKKQSVKGVVLVGQSCYLSKQSTNEKKDCVLLVQSIFHLVQLELQNKTLFFFYSFNFTIKIRLAFFSSFDHKRWWYKKNSVQRGWVLLGQSCYLSEQSAYEISQVQFSCFIV